MRQAFAGERGIALVRPPPTSAQRPHRWALPLDPYHRTSTHAEPRIARSAAGQVALESTPFSRCGISSSLLAEFGSDNFRLSQVHVGSGYRLRKVLEKAERGEKLTIGVLGGSGECLHSPNGRLERRRLSRTWPAVSLGHGTDPESGQRNKYGAVPPAEQWHQFVVRYIQQTFPAARHEFRLGAKAATDSSFFEWCWSSLM